MPVNSREQTDLGQSFAAIDFETATNERNSACAVGVVVFEQGLPTDTRQLLIRPPDNDYDPLNTMIHGIGPSDTRRSPEFPEVWERVAKMIDGRLVVAHNTAFDLSVLRISAEHHGYEPDPFPFACTYRIARSAMPDATSWSLDVLANEFGIPLSHHDPLSDAHAAGLLWLALPPPLRHHALGLARNPRVSPRVLPPRRIQAILQRDTLIVEIIQVAQRQGLHTSWRT